MPPATRSRVVLPTPLRPPIQIVLPAATLRHTPSRSGTPAERQRWCTSRSSSSGRPSSGPDASGCSAGSSFGVAEVGRGISIALSGLRLLEAPRCNTVADIGSQGETREASTAEPRVGAPLVRGDLGAGSNGFCPAGSWHRDGLSEALPRAHVTQAPVSASCRPLPSQSGPRHQIRCPECSPPRQTSSFILNPNSRPCRRGRAAPYQSK